MKEIATLGLRAHSGWAAAVALAGPPSAPRVLARQRLEFADPKLRHSKQPYHAAAERSLVEAEKLIAECTQSSADLAFCEMDRMIAQLKTDVCACGLLLGSGRPLPDLAGILRSHALIHAAEGEMFRGVLAQAAERLGLRVIGVKEKQIWQEAASQLNQSSAALASQLKAMGKSLGPPWREDERLATLAAWIALAQPAPRAAASAKSR
jgi:hypothetical protein